MPVNANEPINDYTGNGTATVYPFTFYLLSSAHLVVTLDGVITTSYTVSGLRNPAGGSITFSLPPGAGAAVRLRRVMPFSRATDYQDAGDLLAQTLDDDIDATVMLIQQLEYAARFYLRNPDTLVGVSPLMPNPDALKLLRWNSAGNALENADVAGLIPGFVTVTSFASTLLDDVSQSEAQSTLGVVGSADTAKLTSAANVFTRTQTLRHNTVASAATLTLPDGNLFSVTGTTNISAIASVGVGTIAVLRFVGSLSIAHSANLVLPGASGITTAAGDVGTFFEASAGVWVCLAYTKADGQPLASPIAPGTIIAFGGTSTPTGFLECNGQNVSTATYPALFSAIGYNWGGSGGTFTLPDLRRRTLIGKGGTASFGPGNNVGNTGGAESHTLTIAQLPSHQHFLTDRSGQPNNFSAGAAVLFPGGSGSATTANTGNTGSDQAHNNMQPSAVVGYFIKI